MRYVKAFITTDNRFGVLMNFKADISDLKNKQTNKNPRTVLFNSCLLLK